MALHIAEQILAAMLTTVTGLTTTGNRTERGRVYPIAENGGPALSVFMGPDIPPEPGELGDNYPFLDCVLEITVRAHSQKTSGVLDTELNLIRKEVVTAVRATNKLGLSSAIINLWEGPTLAPAITGAGSKRTATQDILWFARYRRLYTDPSLSS